MIRSGDLRHKITIQERTQTADGMGGFTDVWSDLYPTRAGIWPMKANEILDNLKLELNVNHRIRIRHPRTFEIKADMRLKWFDHIAKTDKYFKIISIINPDKRNVLLELLCIEEV
jgi:SPP1 family predicted phage head-tail adaptor